MTLILPGGRSRIEPVLFRLDARDCIDDSGIFARSYGQKVYGVLSRPSPKRVFDRNGRLLVVPVGAPPLGVFAGEVTVPLEALRRNDLLWSEDFTAAAWSNVGTPTVTPNTATAPDGRLTADTIADTSAVEGQGRRQTRTVTNDSSPWCGSVFVRVQASTPTANVCLNVRLTGGTPVDAYITVNPQTGASFATGAAAFGVERWGDYWRIYATAMNNSTGNTSLLVTCFPAFATTLTTTLEVAAQGSAVFWGAQADNAMVPSSYTPTQASTVTRNADSLYFPFAAPPQAMTLYVRGIERGTIASFGTWVHIGANGSTNPRLRLVANTAGNPYLIQSHNLAGSNVLATAGSGSTALGDRVEIRGVLRNTGALLVGASINGAGEVVGTPSAAQALEATWADSRLYLNATGNGSVGQFAYTHVVVAAGERTLAEMRELAGV